MNEKLILIGGGGHCQSIANTVLRDGFYDEVVVTDRAYPHLKNVLDIPVIGSDERLPELKDRGFCHAFVAVGSIKNTQPRHLLYERALRFGFYIPRIIDPSAQISRYAELETGVFVGQNVVVNAGTHIGKMAIINTGALIEHTCTIGEYSHVALGAKLCGNVSIGHDTLIGAGAIVIQGVRIGNQVCVGAGSIVLRDVQDGQTVMGFVK